MPSLSDNQEPQSSNKNNGLRLREEVQSVLDSASNLGKDDVEGALATFVALEMLKPSSLERLLVTQAIADATKLTDEIIAALCRDALRIHQEHGHLADSDDLARALRKDIEAKYGLLNFVDGEFWFYISNDDNRDYGTWEVLDRMEIEDHLIRDYKHPGVRTKSERREVMFRLEANSRKPGFFDDAGSGLCLENGFLVFEQGALHLRPHDQNNKARFKIPVSYNDEATCERFMSALTRGFGGDEGDANCYLQHLACTAFGVHPVNDPVRRVLILFGPARSGKSTYINLATKLFPPSAIASVPPEDWHDAKKVVQLHGKALNVLTELQTDTAIKGHALKKVASGEPVTGRRLYRDAFTFKPSGWNLWACNQLPRIGEQHHSMERRFMVLQMGASLSDEEVRTTDFDTIASDEAEGIVTLLGRVLLEVMQQGQFTLPADNQEYVLRMQYGDDPAQVMPRAMLEPAPGKVVTSKELQALLRACARWMDVDTSAWASNMGMKTIVDVVETLHGGRRKQQNGAPHYEGICIKEAYRHLIEEDRDEYDDDDPDPHEGL